MFLGQLYYYNKILNSIKPPLTLEQLAVLDLASMPKLNVSDFEGLSIDDVCRKIKDQFSKNYENLLKQESLNFAFGFWQNLTSSVHTQQIALQPKTDFQSQLIKWQQNDFDINQINQIIREGQLVLAAEDFAIFYGIRVLALLSNLYLEDPFKGGFDLPDEPKTTTKLSDKPNILVLTSEYFSPLFVNLGCRTCLISDNNKAILKDVLQILSEEEEIRLILIDSKESEIENYLQKHLPNNLLISTVKFTDFSQDAFFDQIVRKTLGVKLT